MKSAIVTGGASGIGAAVAARLLANGWHVAVWDIAVDNSVELNSEKNKLIHCDITDILSVEKAMDDTLSDWPPLKGAVNCAGIGRDVPVLETTAELFRQILDINVIGTFNTAKACAQEMMKGEGGAIVNISSVAGACGNVGRVAYGSSKGAVNILTQTMALELAEHSVRVNAIAPGPIETPMVAKMHDAEIRNVWKEAVPQARYGTPEDVAAACAFLLSDEAAFITGDILNVDGGFCAAGIQR
ncbi:MAG: SDR family NAD(P)-dependent oxidoreductase [Hyphomicrobiales bacterium]